ncbi:TssA family type VI secretion system protein [Ectothiorhodospira lacustris]|uniref:TssA family type VI secretion system protein n=1 Tax=Ectothiorhodospira lacustris TaxID=2899127 RepID=UPI001EE82C4C|nr:TssA family type VI secretion system protein [Ectothiorhodospira lacustris]MCG5499363.1 TssA family type VI secretion system protein [Ectothiorhodospira lacustris]MCG5509252.1 TssA family type VI secretion system protein [Ectothiorhodospira lacustris]MCG5521042.1 TssA family type VI secretion system protein [Ectothiorhodospira lacustris]
MDPSPLPAHLRTRLEDIAGPGEMNCDEDPRFNDGFIAIREKIEQLHGVDFDHLIEMGNHFLHTQAKDLRIAGYLLLALVTRHGPEGLAAGLRLYHGMIRNHWDHCHPRSLARRRAALAWLDNERLERLLQDRRTLPEPSLAKALHATMGELEQELMARDPEGTRAAPPCRVLRRWIDHCQPSTAEDQAAQAPEALERGRGFEPSANPDTWLEGVRGFHDHLLAEGELLQACALAQAARWGSLGLPPARQGVTRIPAPRSESWEGLESILNAGDWAAAFRRGMECFFEPGFHLALDLQYRLARATEGMDRPELGAYLQGSVRLLLKRLPELEALCFEDGRPFMDEATRRWLSESPSVNAAMSVPPGAADTTGQSFSDCIPPHLPPDMDWETLNRIPAMSLRDRARLGLLQADLSLRQGRRDVAHDVLVNLHRQLDQTHVLDWDPEIASALLGRLHATAKALDPTLARACARRLCAVAPVQAMTLPAIESACTHPPLDINRTGVLT